MKSDYFYRTFKGIRTDQPTFSIFFQCRHTTEKVKFDKNASLNHPIFAQDNLFFFFY